MFGIYFLSFNQDLVKTLRVNIFILRKKKFNYVIGYYKSLQIILCFLKTIT